MRVRASAVACLALASALAGCPNSEEPPKTQVAVGTRNLYLGTPIELALVPPPAGQTVYDVIDQLWGIVRATDFPARVGALADEIAAHRPALMGLQEVALWRTQCDPALTPPPCGDGPWNPAQFVVYDFLQLLLDALRARGLTYTEVASVVNFDGEFTGASGNDYRYTDRDVIIAMQGVPVTNARGGNFDAALTVDVGGFPITITRGWVSVDATLDGKTFRFASAHPDDTAAAIQGLQVTQFLDEVSTTMPLLAVGDFNSNPTAGETRPGYRILTAPATGLSDTWVELRPSETGSSSFSCCRDGLLADPSSQLYERIDLILHGQQFSPVSIDITAGNGSAPISATEPVWPSDHAGMFGVVQLN